MISRFIVWWLFSNLVAFGLGVLYYFNFFEIIYLADKTYLWILISTIYVMATGTCLWQYFKTGTTKIETSDQFGTVMVTLGFIGTMIGMCFCLGDMQAIGISYETRDELTDAIAGGMYTSLYTSITGMVLSLLNMIQFDILRGKKND